MLKEINPHPTMKWLAPLISQLLAEEREEQAWKIADWAARNNQNFPGSYASCVDYDDLMKELGQDKNEHYPFTPTTSILNTLKPQ